MKHRVVRHLLLALGPALGCVALGGACSSSTHIRDDEEPTGGTAGSGSVPSGGLAGSPSPPGGAGAGASTGGTGPGGGGTGGAGVGGTSPGGAGTAGAGTAGAGTGGVEIGGAGTGGAGTGGASTGGAETGGVGTGGGPNDPCAWTSAPTTSTLLAISSPAPAGEDLLGLDAGGWALVKAANGEYLLHDVVGGSTVDVGTLTATTMNSVVNLFTPNSYSPRGHALGLAQPDPPRPLGVGLLVMVDPALVGTTPTGSGAGLGGVQTWLDMATTAPARIVESGDGLLLAIQLTGGTSEYYEFQRGSLGDAFPASPVVVEVDIPGTLESYSTDGRHAWWHESTSALEPTWHSRLLERPLPGQDFASTPVSLAIPELAAGSNFAFNTAFAADCSYVVTIGSPGGAQNQDVYRLDRP